MMSSQKLAGATHPGSREAPGSRSCCRAPSLHTPSFPPPHQVLCLPSSCPTPHPLQKKEQGVPPVEACTYTAPASSQGGGQTSAVLPASAARGTGRELSPSLWTQKKQPPANQLLTHRKLAIRSLHLPVLRGLPPLHQQLAALLQFLQQSRRCKVMLLL